LRGGVGRSLNFGILAEKSWAQGVALTVAPFGGTAWIGAWLLSR
ncbi:MAG: hypothetical protein RL079_801, partial [Verrucomicrobiota bacterium]